MDGQLKILLIEDDLDIGLWTRSKLDHLGENQSLDWITSLNHALNFLSHNNPDIIVLDLKLPDGNGIEILKKIKNEKLSSRVFVFSINTGLKQTCLRMGADAFIDKSDESEKLIQIISEFIKERKD